MHERADPARVGPLVVGASAGGRRRSELADGPREHESTGEDHGRRRRARGRPRDRVVEDPRGEAPEGGGEERGGLVQAQRAADAGGAGGLGEGSLLDRQDRGQRERGQDPENGDRHGIPGEREPTRERGAGHSRGNEDRRASEANREPVRVGRADREGDPARQRHPRDREEPGPELVLQVQHQEQPSRSLRRPEDRDHGQEGA